MITAICIVGSSLLGVALIYIGIFLNPEVTFIVTIISVTIILYYAIKNNE